MSSSNMGRKRPPHNDVLRTLMPVFRYEIRQGLRSPAWWALMLNFLLPVLIAFTSPTSPWVLWERRALLPLSLVQAFLIVTPLVLLTALTREFPRQRYEIFWTRAPHTGWVYVAKGMAGLALLLLAAAPVLGYVALTTLVHYGGQGVGLLLFWCLWTLVPLFLVYVALSLGFTLLFPQGLLAQVLSVMAVVALILLSEQALPTQLWTPLGARYFTPVTLFVPFQDLMIGHGAFWALLALGFTLHAMARMSRKAPRLLDIRERKWIRWTHRWAWGLLLLALLPAWHFYRYQATHFDETPIEQVAPPQVSSCPQEYTVTLSLDWERGLLEGQAAGRGGHAFVLRSGLKATSAQQGATWILTYRGHPRWPRQELWCPECLRDVGRNLMLMYRMYPLGWYFVKGALFLSLAGDWHPYPGCPIELLRVRITPHPCPDGTCVAVASGAQIESHPQVWEAIWSQGLQTGPVLAIARTYHAWEKEGRRFLLPWTMFSAPSQQRLVHLYTETFRAMEAAGLSEAKGIREVAVVPLLRYPRWGNGLLWLPQAFVAEKAAPEISDLDYRRTTATYFLVAWWCRGEAACLDHLAQRLLAASRTGPAPLDEPETARPPSSAWLTVLDYASLRLVAPETSGSADADWTPPPGRDRLSTSFWLHRSPTLFQVLDEFYRTSPEAFWQALRAYRETFGWQEVPPEQVLDWLNHRFPQAP